ncbi:MAG: MFS transporter [Anaerolineaceae bacterium]|nr:MFS transporter [Anaerolineaceae bacterium]
MNNTGTVVTSTMITEKPTRQRILLLVILFITLLVAYLDRVNVSVLIADNAFLTDMGIKGQAVQSGMLMSMFLIAYGLSNVLLSPLGDIIGPRKTMSLSILLWAIALALGGLTSTFMLMLAARVLLGLGEGMHWPMNSKFVKNWIPPSERGKANSIWLLGIWIGPALAMPLFSWAIAGSGWRESFFGLALLGLVPLYLLWFYTADYPHQSKRVNQAELSHIEAGTKKEAELEQAIGKTDFWETAKTFIFNYQFWLVVGYYTTSSAIYWGMLAWLPSYLKVARNFSWADMGMLASLPFVLGAVASIVFGYISDRVGRRAPFCLATGVVCTIALYYGALASDNMTSALLIAVGTGAVGIGHPSVWSLLQQVVPGKAVGTGAGMMNGVSNAICALIPVIIGFFISLTGSYFSGLMVLVCLGIAASAFMLILTLQKY